MTHNVTADGVAAQTATAQTATRFTTVWGGCVLAASALISLLVALPFVTLDGVTAVTWFLVPGTISAVIAVVATLMLAGAVYILGFGIRGETGLVGDSRIGRIAAIVFVAATVVKVLIQLFFIAFPQGATAAQLLVRGYVQASLGAIVLASVVVAVIIVVRRGMLNRTLRWGLIVVTAWTVLWQAIWYIPVGTAQPDAAFMTFLIFAGNGYSVGLVLQTVLGVGIALHGQSAALRRRAATINEHW